MKVLFVGDAVVPTGFARCTHAACDALHRAGHEVYVLGINYWGDPHPFPYPIYPCFNLTDSGTDSFGEGRLPVLADRIKPDVIIILQDPWNIQGYLDKLEEAGVEIPVIGWLAVDGKNQKAEPLNKLAHIMTWTEFGKAELQAGGYQGSASVVPLGVEHNVFRPLPKDVCREMMKLDPYRFIITVVGRNQPRKRLDLTLSYYNDFVTRYRAVDSLLILHVAPTGEHGFDLKSLVEYFGLQTRVMVTQSEKSKGVGDDKLAVLYGASDVLLTTTQGEGWGLPVLEAMACGLPCVVPNWSALGDWPGDSVIKVPCKEIATTAPTNGKMHTIGGIMDREACSWALNLLYRQPGQREMYSQRGIERAARYSWKATGDRFVEALEQWAAPAPAVIDPVPQGTALAAGMKELG